MTALGLFGLAGCDLDVPDLNNPSVDDLERNPTQTNIAVACTGLLIGNRIGISAANGYITQTGVLGREAYNFDAADPRLINELLEGALSPGSPFGGGFWAVPYSNLRMAAIILRVVEDAIPAYTEEEQAAIRGFVNTIRALDLYRIVATRDEIGGVIEVGLPIEDIAPMVDKVSVLEEMGRLLDEGAEDLAEGGSSFPFPLSRGFQDFREAGFDTPATFREFNRALRARTAAYLATAVPGQIDASEYDTTLAALEESFINEAVDDVGGLEEGVYYTFGTGVGDTQNALISVNIFAHNSVKADVVEGDARYMRKILELPVEEAGGRRGLSSNLKFKLYTDPDSKVSLLENEELILLRAEARWFTGDTAGAVADLNLIRDVSGSLPALTDPLADDEAFLDELLYNRRYSLLFEGHRLIDLRRFDRLDEIPLDFTEESCETDPACIVPHVLNVRWPLPSAECDARPGEPRCAMGSQI